MIYNNEKIFSWPLSITDLIPDFKETDADKIINKLNLKISNKLF